MSRDDDDDDDVAANTIPLASVIIIIRMSSRARNRGSLAVWARLLSVHEKRVAQEEATLSKLSCELRVIESDKAAQASETPVQAPAVARTTPTSSSIDNGLSSAVAGGGASSGPTRPLAGKAAAGRVRRGHVQSATMRVPDTAAARDDVDAKVNFLRSSLDAELQSEHEPKPGKRGTECRAPPTAAARGATTSNGARARSLERSVADALARLDERWERGMHAAQREAFRTPQPSGSKSACYSAGAATPSEMSPPHDVGGDGDAGGQALGGTSLAFGAAAPTVVPRRSPFLCFASSALGIQLHNDIVAANGGMGGAAPAPPASSCVGADGTPTRPRLAPALIEPRVMELAAEWNAMTPQEREAYAAVAAEEQRRAVAAFDYHCDDLKRIWKSFKLA